VLWVVEYLKAVRMSFHVASKLLTAKTENHYTTLLLAWWFIKAMKNISMCHPVCPSPLPPFRRGAFPSREIWELTMQMLRKAIKHVQ